MSVLEKVKNCFINAKKDEEKGKKHLGHSFSKLNDDGKSLWGILVRIRSWGLYCFWGIIKDLYWVYSH